MILAFSLTSNTFLVSGEAGGTGKYLEINFLTLSNTVVDNASLLQSSCKVTALKVSSDYLFTYTVSVSSSLSQKVGAGTVLLEAIPDASNGWEFSYFVIRETEESNFADYKTEKYDIVYAVFDRISHPVEYSVVDEGEGTFSIDGVDVGSAGTINVYHGESVTFDLNPAEGYYISNVEPSFLVGPPYTLGPIVDDISFIKVDFTLYTFDIAVFVSGGMGEVLLDGRFIANQDSGTVIETVDYGTSPTFEFIPYSGEPDSYHLSSVFVDETTYVDLIISEFTQSYQFPAIKDGIHSLTVDFSVDGRADIPEGLDVTVFLSNAASLTFDDVDVGYATGDEYNTADVLFWDVRVVGTFEGNVIVAFRYNEGDIPAGVNEEDLRLYISDFNSELYLRCDLNDDGKIDGQDVKIISNIIKHPKFLEGLTEEELAQYNLDGDPDGVIDENDIQVVNSMKNVDWIDITYDEPGYGVDTENNIIYGQTGHFSIFRGR